MGGWYRGPRGWTCCAFIESSNQVSGVIAGNAFEVRHNGVVTVEPENEIMGEFIVMLVVLNDDGMKIEACRKAGGGWYYFLL